MNRQSTIHFLVVILCGVMISSSNAQQIQNSLPTTRIWSDDSGSFSIEAKLLKINPTSVTLKKLNNVVIEVPLERLSQADRNFLQENTQPAKKLIQPRTSATTATAGKSRSSVHPSSKPSNQIADKDIAPYLRKSFRSKPDPELQTTKVLTFPEPNLNYRAKSAAKTGFGQTQPGTQLPKLSVIDFGARASNEASTGKPTNESQFGSESDDTQNSFFTEIPQTTPRLGANATTNIIDIPAKVLAAVPAEFKTSIQLIANGVDHRAVRQGLRQLGSAPVPSNDPAVIEAVRLCANSNDSATRRLVIEYLAATDPQGSINWIFDGINDSNFDVRWISYRILEKMGDTRVIPELSKRFAGEDRAQIVLVLSKLGGESEPYIIPYLNSEAIKVQLSACSLLGQIGGQGSLQSLSEVSTQAEIDPKVRLQAQNSIEMIRTRIRSAASTHGRNQFK